MIDLNKYLGLPYDINNEFGVNCWGLYKLIQKQERGIDVLMFSAVNSSVRAIGEAFKQEFKLDRHGHRQVAMPRDFDLVVMTRQMKGMTFYHCGIYLYGKILHARGSDQEGQVWYEDKSALTKWQLEYWRYV